VVWVERTTLIRITTEMSYIIYIYTKRKTQEESPMQWWVSPPAAQSTKPTARGVQLPAKQSVRMRSACIAISNVFILASIASLFCPGHVMLHRAEESEGRRKRAAAAASDSLFVQSLAPVPPPLQNVTLGKCTHGRQKSICRECGGYLICSHGRRKELLQSLQG
jgi:hypothetical protein